MTSIVIKAAVIIAAAVNPPTFCKGRASPSVSMKKPVATISAFAQMAGPFVRAAEVAASATVAPSLAFHETSKCTAWFTPAPIMRLGSIDVPISSRTPMAPIHP